jgi:histone-lysine N-methyltransferase SETMAR
MLCVWWTARVIVHCEPLPAGQTINATVYSEQLERVHEKLKTTEPALVTRKGVVLLHGNAKPHVAKMTRKTIIRLCWETLVHPPYSPDIAPSDCHLFHSLDNHLRGRQFRTLDGVKTAPDGFFASRSKEFYHNGVHGLPSGWQKIFMATVTIFDATGIIFINV